jgi:predicted enzyme related to lactoylglutathione lyase
MSERTEYAPGTPSWADNASAEPAKAAEFYSQLFGWQTVDRMPPEADGEYHVASLRGKDVAALGSQPMEGVPAVWNTYVTVDDVEETAEKVKDAGGTVIWSRSTCSTPGGWRSSRTLPGPCSWPGSQTR